MRDLIERLEKATEGSRELDRAIAEDALGLITEWLSPVNSPVQILSVVSLNKAGARELPSYTTSLDAKLPGENIVTVQCSVIRPLSRRWYAQDASGAEAWAHTEPLARRIAALKAREPSDG